MALTAISSASSANAAKSINVKVNATASTIIYTVPSGKKFKGHLWTTESSYFGVINNVQMRTAYLQSSGYKNPLPIELTAGDVVKSSPTSSDHTMLQGLESDA